MVKLVVDSSTIISCAMNCMLWIFDELKKKNIEFITPTSVREEVINSGLSSQRFKYEAIRVMHHFVNSTFDVVDEDVKEMTNTLMHYANTTFYIKGNPIKVLQDADVEVAVTAFKINADAILTDEKTLRMFIEDPNSIKKVLEERFKTKIKVDEKSLFKFRESIGHIPVFRSTELAAFAFEEGLFDPTITRCEIGSKINCKKEILEGILFSLKFAGCAISFDEINQYMSVVLGRMQQK